MLKDCFSLLFVSWQRLEFGETELRAIIAPRPFVAQFYGKKITFKLNNSQFILKFNVQSN